MIRGHGDDLHAYPDIKHNFSSNVYAQADHGTLVQYLQERMPDVLGSYPEPEPYTLQRELAEAMGRSPEEVIVTNGATEAIYLIAQATRGRRSAFVEPTFSEYRDACQLMGHICLERPLAPCYRDLEQYAQGEAMPEVVWLCSPNNPTGQLFEQEAEWVERYPDTLFVIDRSYEYFCRKPLSPELSRPNVIYIHSLTKRYRIPGLRLGYITASSRLAERVRRERQPWSVNALAIEAGLWIVRAHFPETISRPELWIEADRLCRAIQTLEAWEVYPSDTHFMLVRAPYVAAELKAWLARERKILIRDASNFATLSPEHLRLSTQSPGANDELIAALRAYQVLHPLS